MISRHKEKIKNKVIQRLLDNEARISYSQEGEDVVLRRYLDLSKKGYYVDVGAHHPLRYSNTKYFYDRGWEGINIDADPSLISAFAELRPRDKNILAGVGSKRASMFFYIFNHSAINTFDDRIAKQRAKLSGYYIVKKIKVKIQPLSDILKKNVPKGKIIDFMSIDVEGMDLDVLKSNDWGLFRPRYLMVECLETAYSLDSVLRDPVAVYLVKKGYVPVAKTLYTVIFGEKNE